MTFNVYPDENIDVKAQQYSIDINDDQFNETDIENYNIEILKEIKIENEKQIELYGNEKIFSFNQNTYNNNNNNNNNNNIDIILLKNGSIQCLYEINNYIQDDEIIIKQKDCQILLNQQDCIKLYKLDQFIYLIQCNYNSTNTIIQILNQSQIFDQMIIPIQSNCQSDSIFNNNQTLIIYNKLCQTTLFYSISISNLLFLNLTKYDLQEVDGFSKKISQLIDIQFSSLGDLFIAYIDCICLFLIKTKQITYFSQNPGFQIKIFQTFNGPSLKTLVEADLDNQQLYLNYEQLNFSSEGFQNVYFIQKYFYVFHFTDKIFVKFKNYYSNRISINSKNCIKIGELPYFMVISNQQLKLIQLILPKSFVSYKNSDKQLIIYTKSSQSPSKVIHLKLFDQNNPIQYFQDTVLYYQMITSKRSNETICLPYKRYQRALPFKINQIIENDSKQITVEHYRLQILSNLHGISSISKFLFIHKFKDDKMILAIIEGSTVMKLLFFQNNQAIKIYKFLLFANLIDIFFNRQAMLITIVYQQSIEIYEIKFDDIQKRIYQTGIMIIKAMQLNFIVYYLLEDCNKVGIKLFQNKFDFEQTKYLFDCKTSLQFIKDDVYINNYTIQFKFKSSYIHKLTLKEQVIEVRNVLADYLLLFTCYHNQQYVKLYRVYQDELFKLYTLPTYNYSILFPFQYRIQKSIVIIKAQSLNQSFYILIYDILQTAVESLISITEIDEEERYQFDFANENEYYFQFQEQFYIQKLDQPCFLLNLSQDSFDFIQDKPLKITTYSQISNQNIDLEFHLININKNYRLQQLNLNQSILKGNIIKIENIFGNIETVEIVGTDNIQVILPLIFNNYSVICEYYRFGICVNRSQIIRNIFGQSTSILYSQDIKSKVYYIGYNPDDSNHAIYTQENGALIISQFNFSDQNQILLQKYKILNKTDQFINFKQIYDLQIFRYLKDLYFIMFQNKPIFIKNLIDTFQFVQFDLLDGIKINNFTYLIFNIKQMQFELIFINFTKIEDDVYLADIFFNKSYELNNLFPNISPSFHQVDFMLIQIYQTIKNNNQIEIKFIVFLKYHLALLMRMILDLNNLDQIQFEQQGIIRYEKDVSFKQSLFIDNNHIILTFELDQNIFINVFDISILSKTKNIDSIQKLKDNNYTAIERYNTTHFVVVERIKESYHQVHLLTIDKLRLQCQQQCTKTAYLKLSNNVSQIVIEINFSTEKDINLVSLQLIILITNFIYIFIRLYCKQKRKCR